MFKIGPNNIKNDNESPKNFRSLSLKFPPCRLLPSRHTDSLAIIYITFNLIMITIFCMYKFMIIKQ